MTPFVARVIFLLVLYCRIFLWNIELYIFTYVLSSYLTFHVFRHLCSQANGSAMKAGGNSKHAFLALPVSKIPAFIPSSWKHSSTRAPRSNASRLTNQTSSSSSKSSIPCLSLSWPSCRPVSPSQRPEGQNLTLPPQTQNGHSCSISYSSSSSSYSSSSSSVSSSSSPSSPSLRSHTAMCRGGQAVHMPSFSSRRSLKASSGQASITPASFTGNMA